MTQPRTTRRVIAAALSVGALLATAACSSGTAASPAASGSASAATGANWDETGPITYAQGKDTSGNLLAQIDQLPFTFQHTLLEQSEGFARVEILRTA